MDDSPNFYYVEGSIAIDKKLLHGHAEDFGNVIDLLIGSGAELPLHFGIACGIDVAAHITNLGNEVFLLDVALFAHAFDVFADQIAVAVSMISWFHNQIPIYQRIRQ